MDKLLKEEEELTFKPSINDDMGVPASMQILHPEMAGVEMKMRQKRYIDHLAAERSKHQVGLRGQEGDWFRGLPLQGCVWFSLADALVSLCHTNKAAHHHSAK